MRVNWRCFVCGLRGQTAYGEHGAEYVPTVVGRIRQEHMEGALGCVMPDICVLAGRRRIPLRELMEWWKQREQHAKKQEREEIKRVLY